MPTYSIPKKKTPNAALNAAQQLAYEVAVKQPPNEPPKAPDPKAAPQLPGASRTGPNANQPAPKTPTVQNAPAPQTPQGRTLKPPTLTPSPVKTAEELAQEAAQRELKGAQTQTSSGSMDFRNLGANAETQEPVSSQEEKAAFKAAQEAEAAAALEEENKRKALEAAKNKAKEEREQKAKTAKDETTQGVDIDGDGKIGYPGREMTEEEMINTQIRNLLQGGASKEEIDKERQAMQDEMKAAEARDIQSTRARTGLGGMGLTGAAGGMESQVRQESAREQALTMADFERKQRQEAAERALAGIRASREDIVFKTAMELMNPELRNKPSETNTIVYDKDGNIVSAGEQDPEKRQAAYDELVERNTAWENFMGEDHGDPKAESEKAKSLPKGIPDADSQLVRADSDNPRDPYDGPNVYYNYKTKKLFRTE